ncbi:protein DETOXIFICATION [Trifolium repens]|nr:protein DETOXIFICATION [Trifolium repens]
MLNPCFAIIAKLKNFEDFVVGHFVNRAHDILSACKAYRKGVQVCSLVNRNALRKDELGLEIMQISVPPIMALGADHIGYVIDTTFIGHIGPVELAVVGISIAIFNQL